MASPSLSMSYSHLGCGRRVLPRLKLLGNEPLAKLLGMSLVGGLILVHIPGCGYWCLSLLAIALRFPHLINGNALTRYHRLLTWKTVGILLGSLLFILIALHPEPASAQLFKTAEEQANTIFGNYIDKGILTFLFGMLRIVIWVSGVGFVMLAVYQAQRGEQWQPLIQNAFIIVAAIVVVEGLSSMFFGK